MSASRVVLAFTVAAPLGFSIFGGLVYQAVDVTLVSPDMALVMAARQFGRYFRRASARTSGVRRVLWGHVPAAGIEGSRAAPSPVGRST